MSIENWKFDTVHSSLNFWVRHLMVSRVHGRFTQWTGSLAFDPEAPEKSKVEVQIEAASVDTREPQRDAHLRSPDFFEVEKFPTLSFHSTRVTPTGDGELAVTGNLMIHGVTRQVVFAVAGPTRPARDPWGTTRVGLSATTKINRKDYGLIWNAALETGGILVGDEVTITLDVQFVKA